MLAASVAVSVSNGLASRRPSVCLPVIEKKLTNGNNLIRGLFILRCMNARIIIIIIIINLHTASMGIFACFVENQQFSMRLCLYTMTNFPINFVSISCFRNARS